MGYYRSKGEERTFPVDNHIPIDGRGVTGASRSYLSKKFYDTNKSLHQLPKFVTSCTGIKIGNDSIIPTLFVIPIQFMTHGHIFEIYVMYAQVGEDPELQSTPKMPPTEEAGLPTELS